MILSLILLLACLTVRSLPFLLGSNVLFSSLDRNVISLDLLLSSCPNENKVAIDIRLQTNLLVSSEILKGIHASPSNNSSSFFLLPLPHPAIRIADPMCQAVSQSMR